MAELAAARDVLILSDEIYSCFCYDESFVSPAEFNERTLVIDGFSKSHGMTGWRLGYAHGPAEIIETMIKLQQYTYVCAPHPVQWAGLTAMDVDMTDHVQAYRGKRDRIVEGLRPVYDLEMPGGAFYCFPRVPHGTDDEFFQRAVEQNLLIVPGHIFSQHHTHFRSVLRGRRRHDRPRHRDPAETGQVAAAASLRSAANTTAQARSRSCQTLAFLRQNLNSATFFPNLRSRTDPTAGLEVSGPPGAARFFLCQKAIAGAVFVLRLWRDTQAGKTAQIMGRE